MSQRYLWNNKEVSNSLSALFEDSRDIACFAATLKVCSFPPIFLTEDPDMLPRLIDTELKDLFREAIFWQLFPVPCGPAACFILAKPLTENYRRSYIRVFLSGLQHSLYKKHGIITCAGISRPLYEACPAKKLLSYTTKLANAVDLFTLDGQSRIIREFPREMPFTLPSFPLTLSALASADSLEELDSLVNDTLITIHIHNYLTLGESVRWLDALIENINRLCAPLLGGEALIPKQGPSRKQWYNYSTFEEFYLLNKRLLDYGRELPRSLHALA